MILLIRMQTCVVTMRNIRSIITVESTGNTSLGFKYAHEKKTGYIPHSTNKTRVIG